MPSYEVICGDCQDVLAAQPSEAVCILADPPWGQDLDTKTQGWAHTKRGRVLYATDYEPVLGDDKPFDPAHLLRFETVVIWGANHFSNLLPASPGWLIWDKRPNGVERSFGDAELAWSNRGGAVRVFRHLWDGFARDSERGERRFHPTQKPVALYLWTLNQLDLPKETLIIDPYLGSGASGVAALRLGYNFLGVELSASYCEQAEARLAAELARPNFLGIGA